MTHERSDLFMIEELGESQSIYTKKKITLDSVVFCHKKNVLDFDFMHNCYSGRYDCHKIESRCKGPSFQDISKRYS